MTYEKLYSIIHTSRYDQFLHLQQKVSRVCWFRLWGVELTSDLIASAESKSGRWAATTTTLQLLDTLRRRYIASCLELQGRLKVRQAIYWGMRPKLSLHVYILVLFAKGGGTLRAIIRWDLESRCHIHQVVRSHVHLSCLYTDQKEGGGVIGRVKCTRRICVSTWFCAQQNAREDMGWEY